MVAVVAVVIVVIALAVSLSWNTDIAGQFNARMWWELKKKKTQNK